MISFSWLPDVVGADLGLGTDHHHVEITQRLAQLIGLIELLHDLVTHLTQLRHRGLIHTVSNQNTHGNTLLLKYVLLSEFAIKGGACSPFNRFYLVCSASNFFRNSTSAWAPSMGMALYTLARRPPTDLWPFRLS